MEQKGKLFFSQQLGDFRRGPEIGGCQGRERRNVDVQGISMVGNQLTGPRDQQDRVGQRSGNHLLQTEVDFLEVLFRDHNVHRSSMALSDRPFSD